MPDRLAILIDPMTWGIRGAILARRGLAAVARRSWRARELLAVAGFDVDSRRG